MVKEEQIRIRCRSETKTKFKRLATEFEDYEDCINKLISFYEKNRDRVERLVGL